MQKCEFHWEVVDVLSSCVCVCVKLYLCEKDKALVMQGAVIHSVTSRACSLCECVCVKMCHQSPAYVWWWSYPPDDPLNQMVCDCMPVRVCVCVPPLSLLALQSVPTPTSPPTPHTPLPALLHPFSWVWSHQSKKGRITGLCPKGS